MRKEFAALVYFISMGHSNCGKGIVNEKNHYFLRLKDFLPLAEELQIARDLFILAYTAEKLHIPDHCYS